MSANQQSALPVIVGGLVVILVLGVGAFMTLAPAKSPPDATQPGSYPGDPIQGEPVKTKSGLTYYDLKVGTGASPSPTSEVKVNYTGWLKNGTKFDSSFDSKPGRPAQPATFHLNQVIKAWTEGVGSMKVGGKRKLIVPPQLGYGTSPPPGSNIPPNATLIFDVELLDILQ